MDGSLSGGQVLHVSCFYDQPNVESDVGGPSWLAGCLVLLLSFYMMVLGGCLLSGGSADCGRLGNKNPDFSYCFKFIWCL